MAELVKIQGSMSSCLEKLQMYADQYNVKYIATFGSVRGSNEISPSRGCSNDVIYIHFMWNYTYSEYDNSL